MEKKIYFEKINFNNKEKLTQELIQTIYRINLDLIAEENYSKFSKELKSLINNKGTIYLLYNRNKVVSTIIGQKKSVDEFYIKLFATKDKSRGFGTILMARVFADQRVNEKIKTISLHPISSTKNILERLTGNMPFKDGKVRKFNSKVYYSLKKPDEKPITSQNLETLIKSREWKVFPKTKNFKKR